MFEVAGWGDPTGKSPAELAAMFAEVERARRRAEAAAVAIVGEVQRSGAHRAEGHASVSGWVRAQARWSNAEATQHRQVADLAAASDEFTRVLAGGGIGWAQAVELGRAHANPRCGHELVGDLDSFLARADQVPHRELRDRIDTWVMLHDLPAAHDTAELAHDARTASITVSRGVVRGSFSGSGAAGAAMLEVFERFRALEFEADVDAQIGGGGGALPRSDAQRR
nr:hypothetical protein [Ilumatobacteraceae bacterium]